MSTMAMGNNRRCIIDKIPSVNIVYIIIIIVVTTCRSIFFSLVHPHIILQIFMLIINTTVYNSNNHFRRPGSHLPGLQQINIGTGNRILHSSIIYIVPLRPQKRIIRPPRQSCLDPASGHRYRYSPAYSSDPLDLTYRIDLIDFCQFRQITDSPGNRLRLVKIDIIPQM
ncbi:unknown [Odoribacter sp. CAG:788]|nr:unknown [Odoribacter sp. CAG:788]